MLRSSGWETLLTAARHAVHDYAVIGTLEEIYLFLEQLIQVFPQWFAPSGGNALQRTYSFDTQCRRTIRSWLLCARRMSTTTFCTIW